MQAGVLDHVPRANLLYSPRNKILSTSLLIEAFLYEEQTRRGISLAHWAEFEDVADHCTVCPSAKPCPVDIDFGDVSIKMRNCCASRARKSFNPGKAAAMAFLTAKDPATIKLILVRGMIGWGYKAQRLGHRIGKSLGLIQAPGPAPAGNPRQGADQGRR